MVLRGAQIQRRDPAGCSLFHSRTDFNLSDRLPYRPALASRPTGHSLFSMCAWQVPNTSHVFSPFSSVVVVRLPRAGLPPVQRRLLCPTALTWLISSSASA